MNIIVEYVKNSVVNHCSLQYLVFLDEKKNQVCIVRLIPGNKNRDPVSD